MRCLAVLAFALLLVGACPLASTAADAPDPASAGSNEAVLDQVWQTVRDHFYDPSLRGLDWASVRARYAPQAAAAESEDALAAVINAMLAELHASHTEFLTRRSPRITSSPTSLLASSAVAGWIAYSPVGRSLIRASACSPVPTQRATSSSPA